MLKSINHLNRVWQRKSFNEAEMLNINHTVTHLGTARWGDRGENGNKETARKEGAEIFHSDIEKKEFHLFENCKFNATNYFIKIHVKLAFIA